MAFWVIYIYRENLREAACIFGGKLHTANQRLHTNYAIDVISGARVTSLEHEFVQHWHQLRVAAVVLQVELYVIIATHEATRVVH